MPWSTWTQTVRAPRADDDSDAVSRNDRVAQRLESNRPNMQARAYNVLALQRDYISISNNRQEGDSLESSHDTVHNLVGGGGHMSNAGYAAFDPVFWLHHWCVCSIFWDHSFILTISAAMLTECLLYGKP